MSDLLVRYIIMASVGVVFFVWPVAHTISARNIGVLLIILCAGFILKKAGTPFGQYLVRLKVPLICYGLLTLWLFVVAVFISPETSWSLGEIKGQWLTAMVALIAGILLASLPDGEDGETPRKFLLIMIGAIVVHVVYLDWQSLLGLIQSGHLSKRVGGLTEGCDKASYLSNMLLALLFAETLALGGAKKSVLRLHKITLAVLFLLNLFSIQAQSVRNGLITAGLMMIAAIMIFVSSARLRRGTIIGICAFLGIVSALVYAQVRADQRWRTLAETIPIAADTAHHKAWLDFSKYPLPLLANGQPVDASNYLRVAWFSEGVSIVREHPLGVGFGRNAFGHEVKRRFSDSGAAHSHSGLLDMAIGVGIPGLLLWLGFFLSLVWTGWQGGKHGLNPFFAMALLFVVIDFGGRMLLDSVLRDHMLQQFLFLAGFLMIHAVKTVARPEQK